MCWCISPYCTEIVMLLLNCSVAWKLNYSNFKCAEAAVAGSRKQSYLQLVSQCNCGIQCSMNRPKLGNTVHIVITCASQDYHIYNFQLTIWFFHVLLVVLWQFLLFFSFLLQVLMLFFPIPVKFEIKEGEKKALLLHLKNFITLKNKVNWVRMV